MSNTTYWCEKKCQCCNIVRIADERNEQLRAEVEELRKDRERYQLIKTAAVVATIGEYCDTFWIIDSLDVADTSITDIADDDYAAIFEHQVDAAIEAAKGGEG